MTGIGGAAVAGVLRRLVATGGDPADFLPVQIDVSYEIKCSNERWASFVITKAESSPMPTMNRFSIIWTGRRGRNLPWKTGLAQIISRLSQTVLQRPSPPGAKNNRAFCSRDTVIADHINENTQFYLNEDGQIVIVFPRYEIAVGAAGTLEFPILAE